VFSWPQAPELGRCWPAAENQFQIAVQVRKIDLQSLPGKPTKRDLQPCVILRWAERTTVGDADKRRLWQQWWHAANLFLPVANTWVAADQGCDLAALNGAPVYQASAAMTSEWKIAAECAAQEAQGLLGALFPHGLPAPVVGYELLDGNKCVVAEAELAWPDRKVAVLLTSTGIDVFAGMGWNVLEIDAPGLEGTLRGMLS